MAPERFTSICIGHSDGTAAHHPTNTTRPAPASNGTWDYFRPVEQTDGKDTLWRTKSAAALVAAYGSAAVQQEGKKYILDLPRGYKLFEHIKAKGDGSDRRDTYLFGHPQGSRFRSPAEFIPHLLYLASKAPENQGPAASENQVCKCKYCAISSRTLGPSSSRKPGAREPDEIAARREVVSEERLGEQEMVGWVMRKGEVVWVWLGAAEELDDVVGVADSLRWAAGAVFAKPNGNPPFRRPQEQTGTFGMEGGSPRPDGDDPFTYTVRLCSAPGTDGEVIAGIPQHFLRPWLSRPKYIIPHKSYVDKEHESIAFARKIAQTVCVFGKDTTIPAPPSVDPDSSSESESIPKPTTVTLYSGTFLGAEKIFIGEPIRVLDPNSSLREDVMVIDNIFVYPGPPHTTIRVNGSVYYICPDGTAPTVSPEQFAQLPWRMRRIDPVTNALLRWSVRNRTNECGELSVACVLGRWYEPAVVTYWMFSQEPPLLGHKESKVWTHDRLEALGWSHIAGVSLLEQDDLKKPVTATLASRYGQAMDVDESPAPSSSGFRSVNPPETHGKSRMARAVEFDEVEDEEQEDEIEDDDDDGYSRVPGPELLAKSPTKRLSFRS